MKEQKRGASVQLRNLVKNFGDIRAVDNITLDIEPGEFVTFLGPSGSGKTTTLMMIAGFEIPDNGEISIDDEPVMFKPAYKRGIGMVFQNYSLFPHMTVERNIGFPLRMRKIDKNERIRRIREALELVKLPGHEKRFPKQLSGGQQQRIALARALVFNPHVLLMDEPLGALDKKLREHMQFEIKQITGSLNITTIYVTHDQSEAMTMSDRIAVMDQGKIEQIGTPDEIYDNPRSYFVADFIGESNFIAGTLDKTIGQISRFISEGGLRFKALTNPDLPQGAKGQLVIRPEKISFVGASHSFPDQFRARIDEMAYLGDITMYKTSLLEDGTSLVIKRQNKFVNQQIRKNGEVLIGWSEKDNCIV